MNDDWKLEFRNVWERGVAAWRAGRKSAQGMFEPADVAFLARIGCTAQELFDFVDDSLRYGDFGFETVLEVTAIRRRYFLEVMKGQPTGRVVPIKELPAKSAEVDGIAWLPRLIVKARIKLRGELNPDLMYGCAGDRPFLRSRGMTLPEFLQLVWDKGDDDQAIVDAVKKGRVWRVKCARPGTSGDAVPRRMRRESGCACGLNPRAVATTTWPLNSKPHHRPTLHEEICHRFFRDDRPHRFRQR